MGHQPHPGVLPCPLGSNTGITYSTALSHISSFINASRKDLNIEKVFLICPKEVFFFFSWEKAKMSASNLGWLSPKQNISVLSAGTKRSVSNHFWQHIKLHFYLSLKLAWPLGHSLSLESSMLFSIWKPGKIGEWVNHWDMNLAQVRKRETRIFRI